MIGGAGVIVTDNIKHFPADRVPRHLDVQTAREFAANTVAVDPARATRALTEIATRHRTPKHSSEDLLTPLVSDYGMGNVAEHVRPVLAGTE